jgi:hypothetical protein
MKIIIFVLLLSIGYPCFSQSDFRSGFIITLANDTVFGLIDYRGNVRNARICTFKPDEKANVVTYTPDQINGYRYIDSKYYISTQLTPNSTEKLFLEFLFKGAVNLFYYRDNDGEHYYIEKGDGRLIELKYKDKVVEVNKQRYVQRQKEYINILSYLFNDSETTKRKVESVKLKHNSLINIANHYHMETSSTRDFAIFEKNKPQVMLTMGPVIGVSEYAINLEGFLNDELWYFRNSDFSRSYNPSFGIFIKAIIPQINERLFFKAESVYSNWSISTVNPYNDGYREGYNKINLVQKHLNYSLSVAYEFPKGVIRPYFQAGYAVTAILDSEFKREYYYSFISGSSTLSGNSKQSNLVSDSQGFSFAVGNSIYSNKREIINFNLNYQYSYGFRQVKLLLETHKFGFNVGIPLIQIAGK